jgi:cell division protein FtsL
LLAARKKVYTKAIEATPRKKQVKKIMPKASPQPVPKSKALSVAVIVILVFTAFLTISRFAEITRNHRQIMLLESDLGHKQDTTELLTLELASRKDLSRIERIASTEIGMKYPDEAQVQYVMLPKVFDDVPDESSETHLTADSGKSIWARILRLLIP